MSRSWASVVCLCAWMAGCTTAKNAEVLTQASMPFSAARLDVPTRADDVLIEPPAAIAPLDVPAVYPWGPTAIGRLDRRFAAPPGFVRAAAPARSFAAFLRTLPLLSEGSPVVDYRGTPLYAAGHHPNIAAVVDLDIGKANLQHCADVVIRLDAEWRYGTGERTMAYKSASGTSLPYARYVSGERVAANADGIALVKRSGTVKDDHALLRSYLDDIFAWANTRSLERDAKKIAFGDLQGGDFFVMSGSPFGHAVLVLDVARDAHGRVALLLGQGYMPAQSFQVLRKSAGTNWFVVEPGGAEVQTPFWPAFPIETLHRL